MEAYSTASGGVFFMPERIEETNRSPVSYKDFVEEEFAEKKIGIFGRRKIFARKNVRADDRAA